MIKDRCKSCGIKWNKGEIDVSRGGGMMRKKKKKKEKQESQMTHTVSDGAPHPPY